MIRKHLSLALAGLIIASSLYSAVILQPPTLNSANLTSVKDTLQTSRLSVAARVDATGTAAGSSHVTIKTTGSAPYFTTSTANLHAGDSVQIGANTYTIVDIIDNNEFSVSPVLASGDADDNDPVYYESKPQHVLSFTTASAVADGYFRVLIPADSSNPNDGNVDDGGFDATGSSIDVVATDTTGYDFVTGVSTASGGTGCTSPANYHCFEVHYSGDGGVGTAIAMTIGNTDGTNTPIAPGPKSSHSEATADTYTFIVRNYDANDNLIDQTSGKIAMIEAVRVTATVDPSISFSIAGVGTGTTSCGVLPDIDTSSGSNAPLAVPFGSLTLNTFKNAAHVLTVSTNADSGYVVTAAEDDELGKDGATSPFIPDTTCDAGTCTISSELEWNTATNNGFGYSLENSDAASIAFQYNDGGAAFKARPFSNIAASESPTTLFSSSTVANSENATVCYRLSVSATQEAGDYENQILYTATATF